MSKLLNNDSALTLIMNDFEILDISLPNKPIKVVKPVKPPINWSAITLSKARINEIVLEAIKEFQLSQLDSIRKSG